MTSAAGAVAGAGLSARLRVDRGRFRLDADLEAADGEIVALLGPNGAGKTTALQVLAGLVPLSAGRVVVGGEVYDDPDAARWVPAQRRSVGVVPQDHLLFPHLSAQDNVAFGLRARGATRRAARNEAHRWLDRLGVADLAGERPARLSGGQAQRVALARALAVEPALLLLDEPLAALDARTRLEVRAELRGHLAGFAGVALLVTHEPLDAMVLADRLVVLEDGAVVQQGPPAYVARHPRTDYVARLAGLNLLAGRATGQHTDVAAEAGVDADTEAPTDAFAQRTVQLPAGGRVVVPSPATGDVLVAFAPAAVSLHLSRPSGSARNAWPGRVIGLVPHGDLVRVEVDGQVPLLADVTPAAVAELALGPGVGVWAAVKASEVTCYPV